MSAQAMEPFANLELFDHQGHVRLMHCALVAAWRLNVIFRKG